MFSSKDKLFMERAFELAVESFDDRGSACWCCHS